MKIAVAMSGGVDSSVAALILKNQGHDIVGITGNFFTHPGFDHSSYVSALEDAKKIAAYLGISHYEFTLDKNFSENVIAPFCSDYLSGKTPNPCIICNRTVKFRELIDKAEELGCHMLATGHYAVKNEEAGRYWLSMACDRIKDQSYFLFMLTQDQLARSLFPVGSMTKDQIREIAKSENLPLMDKPDSQEICFIPDNDYAAFIERWTGTVPPEGDIVDSSGKIIGRHRGLHRYTIGQRRGMGIAAPVPLYVTALDCRNNRLIAGPAEELNVRELCTENAFHMKRKIESAEKVLIKTRSTQKPVPGTVSVTDGIFHVLFDEPQTGISPGQAAVFYDETDSILGGGIIRK